MMITTTKKYSTHWSNVGNRYNDYSNGSAPAERAPELVPQTKKTDQPEQCLNSNFDQFAQQIEDNRFDLAATAATLGLDFAVGTMPKVPGELRGLGVPSSELNPYTSQLSRWSGRFGTRVLREIGRIAAGVAVGTAATLGVVFQGLYDWGVIGKAAWDATSAGNCGKR